MSTDSTSRTIPLGSCPICGKPAAERHRPFCSRRCALIDLNRWFGGNYRVPARGEDDEGEDAPGSDEGEAG
jgi:uncharacterized protein